MCSESHYCTLVEYIICHAAFTGCHLAERLRCSWKPLSASNDIIKIGARGVAGAGRRRGRGCRFPCPEMRVLPALPAGRGLRLYGPRFAAAAGHGQALRVQRWQAPRAAQEATVVVAPRSPPLPPALEGSDPWTARPAAGCPSTVPSHGAATLRRARGVRPGLGWGHGSWEAPLEALLPGAAPARPG